MKNIFSNKVNIVLVCLLAIVLGGIGGLLYNYFAPDTNVYAINFAGYTDTKVKTWCKENNIYDKCIINYEYNNNVDENTVIYQSIVEGDAIDQNIVFTVSKGKQIIYIEPLKIDENLNKEKVEEWAKTNNINKIKYIEKYDDKVSKGNVISINPNTNITTDSKISVTISLGEKSDDKYTITIKDAQFINYTVEEFEAKAKELKLTPKYTDEYDDYSSTVEKGNILWHGHGEYEEEETFRYSLSLGKDPKGEEFEIKKEQFIKLTEAEIKKKAEELKLEAVHNEEWDEYSDTIAKGLVVRNGFGMYTANEKLRYGLSLGKKETINYPVTIAYKQYNDYTVSEFETKMKKLGLNPYNDPEQNRYSDTIEKGKIAWHGSGDYEKDEKIRYGLSLGKQDEGGNIVIEKGAYIGLTISEFEAKAKELGLVPVHNESWDEYSSTVKKDNIVMHGSASDYHAGENFRYGLSLGPEPEKINITANQYVGKSVTEFEKAMNDLGLKIKYYSENDDYSSSISAGNIIWHGKGTYSIGESISYSKSLGADPRVSVSSGKEGTSEENFIAYIEGLGLKANKNGTASSETYSEGTIVSYDKGAFNKGATINYIVSTGKNKLYLLGFNDICSQVEKDSYAATKSAIEDYLSKQGFTNISVVGQSSRDFGLGKIASIKVNGNNWSDTPTQIAYDSAIVINVVDTIEN